MREFLQQWILNSTGRYFMKGVEAKVIASFSWHALKQLINIFFRKFKYKIDNSLSAIK